MQYKSSLLIVPLAFIAGGFFGAFAVYPVSVSSGPSFRPKPTTKTVFSEEQKLQDAETATFAGRVSGLYDVEFLTTPDVEVDRLLELLNVSSSQTIVDLGCGDGRIPISFAKKFGCQTVGYEFNEELLEICHDHAQKEGVTDRVRFEKKNIFDVDLTPFDFVYAYLRVNLNARLIPQLKQLSSGATIICREFEIPGAKIDQTLWYYSDNAYSTKFFIYKAPLQFDPDFRPEPGSQVAMEWQKALPEHPASVELTKSQPVEE